MGRKPFATPEDNKRAHLKWLSKSPENQKLKNRHSKKSTAFSFVRKVATLEELKLLKTEIQSRMQEIKEEKNKINP